MSVVSGASSSSVGGPGGPPPPPPSSSSRSRADRDRLRDYYGLGASSGDGASTGSSIATTTAAVASSSGGSAYDSAQKYKTLVKQQNFAGLLRAQSDLQTEIRELDGDRKSLVYNHHTDLVSASETIRQMKDRADALGPTLASLSASFDSMAKLETQLRGAVRGTQAEEGTMKRRQEVKVGVVPIVTLPQRLRDLIATKSATDASSNRGQDIEAGLSAAEALWGRHESILSGWVSEGVPGAEGVASECRSVLREERERVRLLKEGAPR